MKLSLATKHFVVIVFICNTIPTSLAQSQEELDAINLLEDLNQQFIEEKLKIGILQWNYASNTRNDTAMAKADGEKIFATFREAKAEELLKFDFSSFENETLKRQIDKMTFLEDAWLDDESFKAIQNAITKMQDIYAVTGIPKYQNEIEMVALEPDIINTFRYSRDPEELKYYWTQWHDKVGTPNKGSFFEYAKLRNEAAKLNGYETGAEMWLSVYEDPTFVQQIDDILENLMPTYKLVHG